ASTAIEARAAADRAARRLMAAYLKVGAIGGPCQKRGSEPSRDSRARAKTSECRERRQGGFVNVTLRAEAATARRGPAFPAPPSARRGPPRPRRSVPLPSRRAGAAGRRGPADGAWRQRLARARSEEHTSELQSR